MRATLSLEQSLLGSALSAGSRLCLAICRGMQLFNVARGGTLEQHVEGHRQRGVNEAHRIVGRAGRRIGPGDRIRNARRQLPSCILQIVDRIGRGLRVAATSDEGYPEALEMPDKKFAIAVQWHPEDLLATSEESRKLFEAFAKSC